MMYSYTQIRALVMMYSYTQDAIGVPGVVAAVREKESCFENVLWIVV